MKAVLEIRHEGRYPSIVRDVEFEVVPRVGEWVELADGWCAKPVHRVTWAYDGSSVSLELHGSVSKEDVANLAAHGWK